MKWSLVFALAFATTSGLVASSASAQGLIWSLPEDGTLVRYKGVYKQTSRQPNSTEGDLELSWDRILEIRSVGTETGVYHGEEVSCRWIEIKVETGHSPEGVLDAGPGGIRMFKLLVPETEIRGTVDVPVSQGRTIFAAFLPIVKGYRKIGDEPTQEITSEVFQLYSVIALLRHYRELKAGEQSQTSVIAGDFHTTLYTGTLVMETNTYRSTNTAEILQSDEFPFGVVGWTAKTVTEEKGTTDQRSDFAEVTIIEEEMKAIAIEEDAQSEFLVN
ncbi:hypothetical protein KOR42_15520 [Thalassoglobus neptunius]|uniref:Uncharacterized protein n=1 Tax=Thalassoglobus neptunius TaxID=1938619 RepID=A0A5C5X753_9PLAN|nr:hypothetical protein [Thalassoglobus neptunius]TWT58181.1 hypothetical protein KOR42_15520 [Thalassoglobus neptunius]